ncbi:cytochrome P450 [Cyathus striatus]|nr:cytochrome P450 [Cyathus striatus]
MMMEGHRRYKGGVFKVPRLSGWLVVLHGPRYLEELAKAPEDTFSTTDILESEFQVSYTMGSELTNDPIHVPVVRNNLTRNLAFVVPELREEIEASFNDIIPPSQEWTPFKVSEVLLKIVARVSNRTFVGLPLCRNEKFVDICMSYAKDVPLSGMIMNMFVPPFLRRLAMATVLTGPPNGLKAAMPYIEKVAAERKSKLGQVNEYEVTDAISWIFEYMNGKEISIETLTKRIFHLNMAAMHTTTLTFLHALYDLASRPEYILPLRQEVEEIVNEEGWTKASVDRMKKIDSFLKESQRLKHFSNLITMRKARKDYKLWDGTIIPKGTDIGYHVMPIHRNTENFPNPDTFDGFRFVNDDGRKFGLSSVNNEFLIFSVGKHACPGRYFAANELKMLLSHIVLNYDIKVENEGVRPKDMQLDFNQLPNDKAQVLFRKRA